MRVLAKLSLAIAIIGVSVALAPSAKADTITIMTGGFHTSGVGNNGIGAPGMDAVDSFVRTSTININGASSFVTVLNSLIFSTGFTGLDSGGPHPFNVAEGLTINDQTQVIHFIGSIDIDHLVDTLHLTATAPLTFRFNTFSLVVNVLPVNLEGYGGQTFGEIKAKITVVPNTAVPEPATLTLLGLGLAGTAAKLRQRRKRKRS